MGQKSGSELHEENCKQYLSYIANEFKEIDNDSLIKLTKEGFTHFVTVRNLITGEQKPIATYADEYKKFIRAHDEQVEWIDQNLNANPELLQIKCRLIHSIEANKARILETSSEANLKESPETGWTQLLSMVPYYFNPQKETRLSTVREYEYKKDKDFPMEICCSTKAEYYDWQTRVSPAFKLWLKVQNLLEPKKTAVHVYFNYLKRDKKGIAYERYFEGDLTKELEKNNWENNHFFTFPADDGMMNPHDVQKREKTILYKDAREKMLAIASGKTFGEIQDFYISQKDKIALYGFSHGNPDQHDKKNELECLDKLLGNSFTAFGFKPGDLLSPAERQAVYFHFIHFELSDFILKTLEATSFNKTCKMGIDRGGVASAYYNLMKSIEQKPVLNEKEFELALHAAPKAAKGRKLNYNIYLIWNTIDCYIKANKEASNFLIKWRNNNIPWFLKPFSLEYVKEYIQHNKLKILGAIVLGIGIALGSVFTLGALGIGIGVASIIGYTVGGGVLSGFVAGGSGLLPAAMGADIETLVEEGEVFKPDLSGAGTNYMGKNVGWAKERFSATCPPAAPIGGHVAEKRSFAHPTFSDDKEIVQSGHPHHTA